eukprot:ctg_1427.g456
MLSYHLAPIPSSESSSTMPPEHRPPRPAPPPQTRNARWFWRARPCRCGRAPDAAIGSAAPGETGAGSTTRAAGEHRAVVPLADHDCALRTSAATDRASVDVDRPNAPAPSLAVAQTAPPPAACPRTRRASARAHRSHPAAPQTPQTQSCAAGPPESPVRSAESAARCRGWSPRWGRN